MPTRANLAAALVATPPAPASSGTTLTVATGKGARFPTPPFNATVGPATAAPVAFAEAAEIVRVTKVTGDELTIVRAFEGPNAARTVVAGDMIAETITVGEVEEALIVAPAPSGGDDSKAVQECYEAMGKPGVLQLRAGTYKFDTGVQFRKYALTLRGHGASSMEVNSNIVTAGTLITCNSRNKAAIECSQAGSVFSDFALLNNANLELGTLSKALSSSGAAITELEVNALAEEIPIETRITTLSGVGPFELGTLSKEIKTTEELTELKVNALAGAIPLIGINGTTKVTLKEGANSQVWTLTAEAAAGATVLKVVKQKPTFNFPITTTKVEGGSFFQQWVTSAAAAKGATGIKVTSLKPNYSYPLSAKIEGGPFPGSIGINITRLNAAGEEKTEGNSRGRYTNVDIEGFNVNYKQLAGFECRFQGCTFNGAVKYQFQYGDPNNTDAGGLFVDNCAFIALKHRKLAAHFRWESGGGVFINNCSFVQNTTEIPAELNPEYAVDFFFEPPAKHSTSNLTVSTCHIEGWEKAGARFFCTSNAEVLLSNVSVQNCEIRSFSSVAGRACVLAESAQTGRLESFQVNGCRFDAEAGTDIKFKNVIGFNTSGNTVLGSDIRYVLEGTSLTAVTSYPANPSSPINEVVNKARAGLGPNYFLLVLAELFPGEELPFSFLYSPTEAAGKLTEAKTYGIYRLKAPYNQTYGYISEEVKTGVAVTALKTKALNFYVPTETKIRLTLVTNQLIFDEFVTSAAALPGATEIKVVEKTTASGPYPANEGAVESAVNSETAKVTVQSGPYLIPGGYKYEVERLDGLSKEVKTLKYAAP